MNTSSQKELLDPKILAQWTSKKQDNRTLIVFGVLSVFFTILGLVLVIAGSSINEFSVEYSNLAACGVNKTCEVTIDIQKNMEKPVYFYYKLNNFYQNHQRYINSKDDDQLKGTYKSVLQLDSCSPIITNEDAGVTTSYDGLTTLNPQDPAVPCGLIAHTLFTDSFTMRNSNNVNIDFSTNGIAWDVDVDNYKNTAQPEKQWRNMEDPRFMNWMRLAGLNSFRKLWGIINQDLPAGRYTITIDNFPPSYKFNTDMFQSDKTIIISTINNLGGKNLLLSVCYLIAAGFSWIVFLVFLVRMIKNRKKMR